MGRLAPAPLPVFRDVTAASRIGFRCDGSPTSQKYLIETPLYHQNGDGTFSDVTERAGVREHSYGMGVATATTTTMAVPISS